MIISSTCVLGCGWRQVYDGGDVGAIEDDGSCSADCSSIRTTPHDAGWGQGAASLYNADIDPAREQVPIKSPFRKSACDRPKRADVEIIK